MPHSNVDEAVAQEAVDVATLIAENASLRDRLLRALADAENIRQRAERTAEEARQYAISDFARELLMVADNLERTIAAAAERTETVEDDALIEGVRATARLLYEYLEAERIKYAIRIPTKTRSFRTGSAICSSARSDDRRTRSDGTTPISPTRPQPGPSRAESSPRSSGIQANLFRASASS
jgi:hypothetical protein